MTTSANAPATEPGAAPVAQAGQLPTAPVTPKGARNSGAPAGLAGGGRLAGAESPTREAAALVATLLEQKLTLATAESLTAGLVSATVAQIPGASAVLRGGAITYATHAKAAVLGVDAQVLREHGPVHPEVAVQMARGAARLFAADVAVATTGVAGPGPHDGHPAGTGYIAIHFGNAEPDETVVQPFAVAGDRNEVRERVTALILRRTRSLLCCPR